MTKSAGRCTFDFGEWKTEVASMRNEDGTASLVAVDPDPGGQLKPYVPGERDGKRVLVIRSGQNEYVFWEAGR